MPVPNQKDVVRVRTFKRGGVTYRIYFYRKKHRGRKAHVERVRRQRGSKS